MTAWQGLETDWGWESGGIESWKPVLPLWCFLRCEPQICSYSTSNRRHSGRLDFKIRNRCFNGHHREEKQPLREPEEVFADCAPDKGLVSGICKVLLQLNREKQTTQFKTWAKNLNRHVSKEDTPMTNKHIAGAKHRYPLRKCKWKPGWGATSHH